MLRKAIAAALLALSLGGCVAHTWAPGPGQSAEAFGSVSGQCKLMALSGAGGGGFVAAAGSPRFVAAYTAGSIIAGAIGSAVQQNRIYNACLEANGFVAVDDAGYQMAETHAHDQWCAQHVGDTACHP